MNPKQKSNIPNNQIELDRIIALFNFFNLKSTN